MPHSDLEHWMELNIRVLSWGIEKFYARIKKAYEEPERKYHTLAHVEACLEEFHPVTHLAINPDAVEFALWFHDAIYNTHSRTNEEESAEFAREMMTAFGFHTMFIKQVCSHVLATKHPSTPLDPDAQLVVDIDLSILGQFESEFDQYERQIREEYSWVSDRDFAIGRTKILQSFLDRPRIYLTEHFWNMYERSARQNIQRSIAQLSQVAKT